MQLENDFNLKLLSEGRVGVSQRSCQQQTCLFKRLEGFTNESAVSLVNPVCGSEDKFEGMNLPAIMVRNAGVAQW